MEWSHLAKELLLYLALLEQWDEVLHCNVGFISNELQTFQKPTEPKPTKLNNKTYGTIFIKRPLETLHTQFQQTEVREKIQQLCAEAYCGRCIFFRQLCFRHTITIWVQDLKSNFSCKMCPVSCCSIRKVHYWIPLKPSFVNAFCDCYAD